MNSIRPAPWVSSLLTPSQATATFDLFALGRVQDGEHGSGRYRCANSRRAGPPAPRGGWRCVVLRGHQPLGPVVFRSLVATIIPAAPAGRRGGRTAYAGKFTPGHRDLAWPGQLAV